MKEFKVDSSNRRLRNLIDKEIIDIGNICVKNETFNLDVIKHIYENFNAFCDKLHEIDSNINLDKVLTPGKVILNEFFKDIQVDPNNLSCNKIRQVIVELLDNLTKSKDLYTETIVTIYVTGAMCDIYINNTASNDIDIFKDKEGGN